MEATETLQRNKPAARMQYLDSARGINIILVVIVHHLLGLELAKKLLMAIVVVPFFFISGMLYGAKKEWEQPFRALVIKNARRLLYPFLTFSVVNLIFNILYFKVVFPSSVPEFSIGQMFLFTVTTYGYNALWFLPCCFWGTLLFCAVRKSARHRLIWLASLVFLLFFYLLFNDVLTGIGLVSYLYCYLFRSAMAMVFLYAGSVMYDALRSISRARENLLMIGSILLFTVAALLYQRYPEHFPIVNLSAHRLGNPYVYYLTAFSASIAILLICKKYLGNSRVFSYFGRNSLIVMALHMDVTAKIAWYAVAKLGFAFGETGNSMIVIAMELVMFPVIIAVIDRYFPFLLKLPKKTKNR